MPVSRHAHKRSSKVCVYVCCSWSSNQTSCCVHASNRSADPDHLCCSLCKELQEAHPAKAQYSIPLSLAGSREDQDYSLKARATNSRAHAMHAWLCTTVSPAASLKKLAPGQHAIQTAQGTAVPAMHSQATKAQATALPTGVFSLTRNNDATTAVVHWATHSCMRLHAITCPALPAPHNPKANQQHPPLPSQALASGPAKRPVPITTYIQLLLLPAPQRSRSCTHNS